MHLKLHFSNLDNTATAAIVSASLASARDVRTAPSAPLENANSLDRLNGAEAREQEDVSRIDKFQGVTVFA